MPFVAYLSRKSANMHLRPLKWPSFPEEVKGVEIKFMDKVPLTPSNVPSKFDWNNQNRFGKKCKTVISDP